MNLLDMVHSHVLLALTHVVLHVFMNVATLAKRNALVVVETAVATVWAVAVIHALGLQPIAVTTNIHP